MCHNSNRPQEETGQNKSLAATVPQGFYSGTPEGTRTPSLQNRNLTLYPIALRARLLTCCFIIAIFPPFVKENFRTPGKDGKYGENPWTSPLGFCAVYPIDRWSLAGYTNSNLGTMEYRQKGNEEKSTCGDTAQRAPAGGKGRGRPEGTWSWSRAPSARRFRGALGRDGGARHSAGVSGNLYAQRPRAARLWVKQGGTTKANRSRPWRLASGAFFDAWTLQPGDDPAPSGAKNQTKRRKSQ